MQVKFVTLLLFGENMEQTQEDLFRDALQQVRDENDRVVKSIREEIATVANQKAVSFGGRKQRFQQFLREVAACGDPQGANFTKSQNLTTGSDGGFMVPEDYLNDIRDILPEQAKVLSLCDVQMINGQRRRMTVKDTSTNQYGGILFYHQKDEDALQETKMETKYVYLETNKVAAFVPVDNSLLRHDGAQVEQNLMNQFVKAYGGFWTDHIINGTGAGGQGRGFLNAACKYASTRSGAGEIAVADIGNIESRTIEGGNVAWLAHPSTMPKLMPLASTNGPSYFDNLRDGGWPVFRGRPIIFSHFMKALGTSGDIALVNFEYIYAAMSTSLEISKSEHYKFGHDQTVYRVVFDYDIQPALTSTVNADGVWEMSPFSMLS